VNKHLVLINIIVLIIISSFLAIYGFWRLGGVAKRPVSSLGLISPKDCTVEFEKRTTRGDSLAGVIEPGTEIVVAYNYYRCRDIFRGDVVAYDYAGNAVPIIKVVRGIPGDIFRISQQSDHWQILVNNEPLTTSRGEPYDVDERARGLIQGYVDSYNGVIPNDTVLLLGNKAGGTLDSTRFGLVHKNDIIGKIIYDAPN
jgi:signal peptidase I